MRARMWILVGMLVALPALAGPNLSKSLRSEVPSEITAQTAVVEADIAAARAQADTLQGEADSLRDGLKTQKIAIQTLEAQGKAEKERLKVAKKAKDKEGMTAIKEEMARIEAQITEAETKLGLAGYEAGLHQAQAVFLRAAADMAEADVLFVWATALSDTHSDIDPVPFGEARGKAETAYQKARADLAAAEADYVGQGGQSQDLGKTDLTTLLSDNGRYREPPKPMTPPSWTNQPAPAPAPAPAPTPSWTTPPAPAPAPVP